MNRVLYQNRCRCKEELSLVKRRKLGNRSEGKALQYPDPNEVTSTTFQLKYNHKLSLNAKLTLNSFQKKYFYYAVDDLLYLSNSSSIERENLLALLYSPILSLQNNFSVDFFDIWIHEIYIDERFKSNKFLTHSPKNLHYSTHITLKVLYKTKIPSKIQELLW